MNNNPKVSILCLAYNQESLIKQTLDSFIMQKTNFDFEIIIHDDASTDKTPDIIREYQNKYPKIIRPIFQKENQFSKGVRGILMKFVLPKASGKYIAICDGDDFFIDKNKLQLQVDFLEKNKDYTICFHQVNVSHEKNEKENFAYPRKEEVKKIGIKELLRGNFIPNCSVMYRRIDYSKIPISNLMPADWYLHLYHARSGKIGFIDRIMSVYRSHSDGIWWDFSNNYKEHIFKNGASGLTMYCELLNLFHDNDEYVAIIVKNFHLLLGEIISIDRERGVKVVKKLLPDFSGNMPDILIESAIEIEDLSKKEENVSEIREEVVLLREELREKKNSLKEKEEIINSIISSRGWRLIEKMRRYYRLRKNPIILTKIIVMDVGRRMISPRLRSILNRLIYKYLTKKKYIINEKWGYEKPLISIVIPFYNSGATIDETVGSVLRQTFQDFECFIIDGGSTEEESIKKLKKIKHPKIQTIHQENQGVAVARNTGIAKTRSRYVMCLDSDDQIDPTYIEKGLLALESDPNHGIFTVDMEVFGIRSGIYRFPDFDPLLIYGVDNPVVTAAIFRKDAWKLAGGYKRDIGYEDWEYWVSLVEKGFWPKHIPETIFRYRTANKSRFTEDSKKHYENIDNLKKLHPHFISEIKKIKRKRLFKKYLITQDSALVNVSRSNQYAPRSSKKGILIAIPWMTFGGAETLICNYCSQIKNDFDISFVTGLESKHEWEYKFKEITTNIYHLSNLFDDKSLYLEFFSNYIKTRDIDVLHIIHNNFVYEFLPELKKRFPKLKIIVTLFNDFAVHFNGALEYDKYIDVFTSDNNKVVRSLKEKMTDTKKRFYIFPNATDCHNVFNPQLFNREEQRKSLNVGRDDLAVFFIGRLSSEKKPDVFLDVAKNVLKQEKNIKFFMIGDGPMKESLLKNISEINDPSPSLTYLGYQSEIPKYLSAADVFVLPSIVEGFPLSIVEAMSMRTVVIASDVGAISDVIENGKEGFIVTPASTEEITEKILLINKDKKIMDTINDRARTAVEEKYSTVILGNNYKRLYEEK